MAAHGARGNAAGGATAVSRHVIPQIDDLRQSIPTPARHQLQHWRERWFASMNAEFTAHKHAQQLKALKNRTHVRTEDYGRGLQQVAVQYTP